MRQGSDPLKRGHASSQTSVWSVPERAGASIGTYMESVARMRPAPTNTHHRYHWTQGSRPLVVGSQPRLKHTKTREQQLTVSSATTYTTTMHVLGSIGHSFSQRRKSPKPKDLHIRKVSFSGCSLSSGCSFSSTSSTSTAKAPSSARTPSGQSFDPLNLHPTFSPPPRLQDRPLISPERLSHREALTFFDDETDEEGYLSSRGSFDASDFEDEDRHVTELTLPPHTSPMDHPSCDDDTEPQDYFMMQLAKRPPMLRSRWSESTIMTLDQIDDLSTPSYDVTPDTETESPLEMPNFSHKRLTAPRRPPMRSLDSLEDFIKRGGWKRRGIVLDKDEAKSDQQAAASQ